MRRYALNLLAGTAAIVSVASAASAADLARPAPPAPIAPVPVFTWTGFYVGVNAGVGWNTNNSNGGVFVPGVGFIDNGGNDDAGFVGGGQVGYNYQIGSFVIGVEGDIQWADIGGGNNGAFVRNGVFVAGNNNNGNDWFGTIRARAGVAFDRVLIYATGGFAFTDYNNNNNCFAGTVLVACGNGGNNTGWTIGGGVEWALPVNWFGSSAVTFGVEGLYVNIDRGNNDVFFNTAAFNNNNGDNEFGVVRAKLNFKFGTY